MSGTFFVTGATGFVGYRLARRLVESGKRVKCLARPTSNRSALAALGVEFVDGDVADIDALRRGATGVDGVFHLAGLTRELKPGEFDRTNRLGVRNVASVCAEIGRESGRAPTLVTVSSLAGAGPAPKREKLRSKSPQSAEINVVDGPGATFREFPRRLKRETDVPNPSSAYGRSKLAGEREALRFADAVPTTIVRPPYVFGEGDAASLELYKIANNLGLVLLPGWLDRYYSFVEVCDLAEILVAAFERGERAAPTSLEPTPDDPKRCSGRGIYFATSPVPIRFSEFGRAMRIASGDLNGRKKSATPVRIPPLGVLGTGVYGEIVKRIAKKQPSLDWNKAVESLSGPWICSGEKAAKQLGIRIETSIVEQTAATARWYVREGWLKIGRNCGRE